VHLNADFKVQPLRWVHCRYRDTANQLTGGAS
jgi:hypothetical protein